MNTIVPGRCRRVQALEDAIKWRRVRAAQPCADCDTAPDGRCADHARDARLITEYEQTVLQLLQPAPDPLDVDVRVTAARDLLAEGHQPAALAAAELRGLLTRYQRRMRGLLDVLDVGAVWPEPATGTPGRR